MTRSSFFPDLLWKRRTMTPPSRSALSACSGCMERPLPKLRHTVKALTKLPKACTQPCRPALCGRTRFPRKHALAFRANMQQKGRFSSNCQLYCNEGVERNITPTAMAAAHARPAQRSTALQARWLPESEAVFTGFSAKANGCHALLSRMAIAGCSGHSSCLAAQGTAHQ